MRVEVGPRDVEQGTCVTARRDMGERPLPLLLCCCGALKLLSCRQRLNARGC